jgi:hypothetical protein
MKLLAGAAALIALGAGLGMYFGLRGSSVPEVPKAQQSAILERAKEKGVIRGYRARRFDEYGFDYRIVGADIRFSSLPGRFYCSGDASSPQCLPPRRLFFLEYRHPAAAEAYEIQRIAQEQLPKADIKVFEVTTLEGAGGAALHIPDARIMLIPKAGA